MRLIDADALPISFDGHTVSVWKKDLDAAPTINPYEWISVEDRLPEENQLVLCYHYYNDVDLCRLEQPFTYLNNNRYYWYSFKERDWDRVQDKDYWMPLPTPPTEKENGYDT